MNINIQDVCKKLYYRMLDVNIGSEDGEDLFADVENGFEVVEQAKKYLNDFNNEIINVCELKEKLKAIEIINNTDDIEDPFVERFSTLGEQLWWLFDDEDINDFNEFLYKSWKDELENNIMIERVYRDNKNDFDNL